MTGFFEDAEIIFAYTREQAIQDGVLVCVSKEAWRVGFLCSVCITQALHSRICDVEDSEEPDTFSLDLSSILQSGINVLSNHWTDLTTQPSSQYEYNVSLSRESLDVKIVLHLGDDGEPVVTIMFHYED